MSRPPSCNICDNDEFDRIGGFYYCTVCNTQSQVNLTVDFLKEKLRSFILIVFVFFSNSLYVILK